MGKSFFAGDDGGTSYRKVRATIVGVSADFMFEGDRRLIVPTFYINYPDDPGTSRSRCRRTACPRRWPPSTAPGTASRRLLPSTGISWTRISRSNSRPTSSRGGCSASSSASPSSSPAWACSGWRPSPPSGAPRRSASARVFGARTRDIVLLLLWQFSIPVLIANLIAWPVAWYYLHDWLEGLRLSHQPQPALFPGRGAGGAGDRLGHGLRPCPARGPRQSHPRPALRVEATPCSAIISSPRCAISPGTSFTASSTSRGWRWG